MGKSMGKLDNLRRKFKRYSEITQVDEIARRYFVMNAFDGCLTILGIIVGAYVAGVLMPGSLSELALDPL